MKVLVCGGRDYKNRRRVFEELDQIHAETPITLVIEGGASGADSLAFQWAQGKFRPVVTHFADWATLGKAAGPVRNSEMLKRYKPDVVLAFPGGLGTANMIKQATEAGVRVIHGDHQHRA
jgi:hypothetical protein